jgi:hypothetical protein
MTKADINQIAADVAAQYGSQVAVAVAHVLSNMALPAIQPKTAVPVAAKAKPSSPALTKRHAAVIAGFKRRGITDPKLFTDIMSYRAWLAKGRQVRKGARSV